MHLELCRSRRFIVSSISWHGMGRVGAPLCGVSHDRMQDYSHACAVSSSPISPHSLSTGIRISFYWLVHVGRAHVNLSRIATGWAHFLCGVGHQMKDLCSRGTGYSYAVEVEEHLRSYASDVRWYEH